MKSCALLVRTTSPHCDESSLRRDSVHKNYDCLTKNSTLREAPKLQRDAIPIANTKCRIIFAHCGERIAGFFGRSAFLGLNSSAKK